ncbi:uncharacterized protein LOC121875623 isoform X2 [Homarus americanus]|uniref:uncharacterized protein LOC121875623 isoform X2 n=1 Tax=Homarus americanus TaxID=6706 RepID=UPI001C440ADC|nr:uncharacterized protein LOC121875623 isoform X2 [Homarus americanus]
MAGKPDAVPTIILPRSDLTLHRAPPSPLRCTPPTRPARTNARSSLKSVPEGWTGSLPHSSVSCETSFTQVDYNVSEPSEHTMPTKHYSSTRSRVSSIRSRTSSVRSKVSSFSSKVSSFRSNASTRSRSSPRRSRTSSIRSRGTSTLRRSIHRNGPLYRIARTQVGSVRRWAAVVRRRMMGAGGVPLLTPARSRRRPEVERAAESPPLRPARNSPRVQATRRAAFAARSVRWETASGLEALLECGGSAGSAAVTGVGRVCAAVVAMADARLQQLRRSISSWSLSTVKKPKITIPKFKKPKLKVFGGSKKNRVDPKDETAAAEEVKAALLKAEGDEETGEPGQEGGRVSGEVIHEPQSSGQNEAQPTIVLTVHDRDSTPDPPPPSPSPGLLVGNDDLEFIDSDAETDDRVVEAIGPDVEYSDQWFDARGTLTRSKENLVRNIDDYDECRVSKYYDAADETAPRPAEELTGAETTDIREERGSIKAREWVQSFNEEADPRVERWMRMQKARDPSSLPKSRSEIRLDRIEDPPGKWSARDEIQLNATEGDGDYASYLRREYNADVKIKENKQQKANEKEKMSRRESLKKIFHVRGKLSIKPIVDSQRPSYTDTDIYIASAPYALANTTDTRQADGESLDVSEDGINCNSIDLDPTMEASHPSLDPRQEDSKESMSNCKPTTIPDIVIDSPGVNERRVEFLTQKVGKESLEEDYAAVTQSENTVSEQVTTEAGDNSTLNDVTWTETEAGERDITDSASREQIKSMEDEPDIVTREPEEDSEPETFSYEPIAKPPEAKEINSTAPPAEGKKETSESLVEQEVSLIASTSENETSADTSKPEPKKKKISGASIPKSIKSFAGSLFSQQPNSKGKNEIGEEKEGDKKKKKARVSPFNKDYLFRTYTKSASEEAPVGKSVRSDNEKASQSTSDQQAVHTNSNPFLDDDGNPFTDEDAEEPEQKKTEEEPAFTVTEEAIPDFLPSPDTFAKGNILRDSPDSLEYISVIESDDQKSISNESSPGLGTSFVEEGGLRLRKDALLAIKSMENDDASTHYYSFLSATDDYQTPTREMEEREQTPTQQVLQGASLPDDDPQILQTLQTVPTHKPTPEVEVKEVVNNDVHKAGNCVLAEPQQIIKTGKSIITEGDVGYAKVNKSQKRNKDDRYNMNTESRETRTPPNESSSSQLSSVPSQSSVTSRSVAAPSSHVAPQSNNSIPPEVPKLHLERIHSMDNQVPPKPSPRSKKGRYGYSTGTATLTTTTSPLATKPNTETPVVSGNAEINKNYIKSTPVKPIESTQMATFPRRKAPSKRVHVVETERFSSDSGYAGPGSNYYGGNDSEPIYWEISETKGAPPRPSPRTKKGQRTPSDTSLRQTVTPSPPSLTDTPSHTTSLESQPIPEWINKRAPIPSPRNKKQNSLQSLPTVVPSDDTMESVKKKLQLLSHEPLQDSRIQQPARTKAAQEEQFYSGKAASISYGFTPAARVVPPSPPLRGRKASQVSLPAAMAADELLSWQQKRRSIHAGDGNGTRPPSVRRARRRTDPTQGMTLPSFKSAVQTEDLLTDLLYSVHSLMGGAGDGMWHVITAASAGGQTTSGSSNRTSVSLEQVLQVLQEAFQVNQDTVDRLTQEVQSRAAPEVNLHLSLKEAKELRPKTVKGTTNCFVTLAIPSSGKSQRSRLEKDTLIPKWNQDFTLRVHNLQKDVLRLEIWHEYDALKVKQLTAVRDIKGLGRLVRGTTAQARHQPPHLLGQVTISVKDVSEHGLNGWYSLGKEEGEAGKDRGSIYLEGSVSSSAHLENKNRHSYDSLLARLVHHQLKNSTNNNHQENEWSTPWNGRVNSSAAAALAQYAIMLDLNDASLQLSWWCVGSRVATVDAAWTLSQLHRVQAALGKNSYQEEDLAELRTSLVSFVCASSDRLKDLHTAYPPSSKVLAQHQLSYTLKALQSIQTHKGTRELLDQERLPHLHETVITSLAEHAKTWWMMMIKDQLRGTVTVDEQITPVINIVDESNKFLTQAAEFYNGIFLKEMNISYMQTTYLMVSKKVNPCVRPLVMNIYNRMPAINDHKKDADDVQYALEVGTSLWQLYMNLCRLNKLGESLPIEARVESGVRKYHRWFSRGVMRWLELAIIRARIMIEKAVDLDSFELVDELCNFSSSSTDTIAIFHDVKIWWLKLAWPDPENSAVLLAKILEDICSCGTYYSDLLRDKVDRMFCRQDNSSSVFITRQICVGLNNIERVRRELTGLPGHFGFDVLLEDVRVTGSGIGAATQLESTVERLIYNAADNMENKVNEFIETVIENIRPTLRRTVNQACDIQNAAPFLAEVLGPAIKLLHTHLHTSNFQRFLWRVWEVIIDIFHATVIENSEGRKASYFGGVHSILQETLRFFSQNEGIGLDEHTAQTTEYTSLIELLESLRMSTEALIAKYYQERHEEQVEDILPSKAQLVVKTLFTRPGKLIVDVLMARDIVVESDACSVSSRSGPHLLHHSQLVDSYVKVQLVPQEWFPHAIHKTKTLRKQDPAVYEEQFEFDMSRGDDGVRAGFLLFTLKDYNLGRTNTFIGEALVPLADLPVVDSSQVHTVSPKYLKMTTPGLRIGYKSLRALQCRSTDKTATTFWKKVAKRLPDSKSTLRPDEEKGRSRSPTLKERLKFS